MKLFTFSNESPIVAMNRATGKTQRIKFMSQEEIVVMDSLNLDYDAEVSFRKRENDSGLFLEIRLHRDGKWQSLIETVLPPGMLVVVSWVSLMI